MVRTGRRRSPTRSARAALAAGAAAVALVACTSSGTPATGGRGTWINTTIATVLGAPSTPPVPRALDPTAVPQRSSRVLLIGDSTMKAIHSYDRFDALRGFEYVFDAQSCRTLGVRSCGPEPVPTNAAEAIAGAPGRFDVVVVMAGYDEWWTSFPASFDLVVSSARARGASTIVWLTYREGVGYTAPDGSTANEAFVRNNITLRELAAQPANADVRIADWFATTSTPATADWLSRDGIHLTPTGAWGLADHLSRAIAAIDGRACPAPWTRGGRADDPCPWPDEHPPPDDVAALYEPEG